MLAADVAVAAGHAGTVEAGVGKRKREDEMAALEEELAALPGTRLPGFVSAGTIQPDRTAQPAEGATGKPICF